MLVSKCPKVRNVQVANLQSSETSCNLCDLQAMLGWSQAPAKSPTWLSVISATYLRLFCRVISSGSGRVTRSGSGYVTRRRGTWPGAGVTDVDVAVIMVVTHAPGNWTLSAVEHPAVLPVLAAVLVPAPWHAGPERVVDTTQVYLCTREVLLIFVTRLTV